MIIDEGQLNDFLVPDLDRPDWKAPLGEAFDRALCYLEGLPDRPVRSTASLAGLRTSLGGPIPEGPSDPREVIAELRRLRSPVCFPPRAAGSSASSSAVPRRRRWRLTGSPQSGTRTPACMSSDLPLALSKR
jgi:hypothetical protein